MKHEKDQLEPERLKTERLKRLTCHPRGLPTSPFSARSPSQESSDELGVEDSMRCYDDVLLLGRSSSVEDVREDELVDRSERTRSSLKAESASVPSSFGRDFRRA